MWDRDVVSEHQRCFRQSFTESRVGGTDILPPLPRSVFIAVLIYHYVQNLVSQCSMPGTNQQQGDDCFFCPVSLPLLSF